MSREVDEFLAWEYRRWAAQDAKRRGDWPAVESYVEAITKRNARDRHAKDCVCDECVYGREAVERAEDY